MELRRRLPRSGDWADLRVPKPTITMGKAEATIEATIDGQAEATIDDDKDPFN